MKSYQYQGPPSGATITAEDGDPQEVLFWKGAIVQLPEDNNYVKTLIALGHLVPYKPEETKGEGDAC